MVTVATELVRKVFSICKWSDAWNKTENKSYRKKEGESFKSGLLLFFRFSAIYRWLMSSRDHSNLKV